MRLTFRKRTPLGAPKSPKIAAFCAGLALAFAALCGPVRAGGDAGQAAFERADYATALKEWGARAQSRQDPDAQLGLGKLYLDGLGVRKDERRAIGWIRKAAEKGQAEAQTLMGVLHGAGRGVAQDYAEAAKWLTRAAASGSAEAKSHLGYLYQTGQGVEQSDAEAFKLYREAAEQDNAEGQLNLGYMYATGRGAAQDSSPPICGSIWRRRRATNSPAKTATRSPGACRRSRSKKRRNAPTPGTRRRPRKKA